MSLMPSRSTLVSHLTIPPMDRFAVTTVACVVIAFLLDVRAPAGYSLWGLYLPAIWFAARWRGGPALLGIGLLVITLTLVDPLLGPEGAYTAATLCDRLVSVAILGAAVFVAWHQQRVLFALTLENRRRRAMEDALRHQTAQLQLQQREALQLAQDADEALQKAEASEDSITRMNRDLQQQIEEREQAERLLRESQDRTRRILDTASNAFVAIDAEGRVTDWNTYAETIFGWSRGEAMGRRLEELILPARYQGIHREGLSRLLAGEGGQALRSRRLEFPARNRTGKEFPVEATIWPTHHGQEWHYHAFIQDITERKAAEQRLHDLNESLERRVAARTAELEAQSAALRDLNKALVDSNRELDDFAYIASHDLKEPLRGISNYARFLMEDYGEQLGDDGRAKLVTLIRLCRHLSTLIDSLLEFSRVGRVDLAMDETDLQASLDEVLDSLRITLEEQRVQVVVPERLPRVRCDGVRVGEIFRNLITNAAKYNDREGKRVEVGFRPSEEPGGPTVFFVRDNGIGIRDKHLDTIFRFFKRLHPRDKYGGGSGAGLTIVKKLVERHGGRIWVESVVGEGSTFYFTLGDGEDGHERD